MKHYNADQSLENVLKYAGKYGFDRKKTSNVIHFHSKTHLLWLQLIHTS